MKKYIVFCKKRELWINFFGKTLDKAKKLSYNDLS